MAQGGRDTKEVVRSLGPVHRQGSIEMVFVIIIRVRLFFTLVFLGVVPGLVCGQSSPNR